MRKYVPYIIAALIAGALFALVLSGSTGKRKKVFDQRITLRKQDKNPYGTYVAHQLLRSMLPDAKIITSRKEPGYWDSVDAETGNIAYIFIGHRFTADDYEMKNLANFAEKGNSVFISTSYISGDADDFLKCNSSSINSSYLFNNDFKDSLVMALQRPFVPANLQYSYPGLTFGSYFTDVDSTITDILGTDKAGKANFIHLAIGKGHFYFHLEPLAFSNFFILNKKNIDYYEKAVSVITPATKKVIWDEYYLAKPENNAGRNSDRKGWFKTLMHLENEDGKRSFQWAFWLLLLLLLLYVLMEMRRRQRYIPVIKPPKNDSLDFVKTIGRLYYDKGDHTNLCRKMVAYFLEHVRGSYKLPTNQLDDKFITQLQYKSGAGEIEIRNIVSFIKFLEEGGTASKEHLRRFHQELEQFYKIA